MLKGCQYSILIWWNFFRCKGCGWPLCSLKCKGLHKEFGHTIEECAVLKHTKSSSNFDFNNPESMRINYNAIVPLRCLMLKTTNPDKYEKLMSMESHNDIRKNIPVIWTTNQTSVVDKIIKEWNLSEYDEILIHTICGILEVSWAILF